MQEAIIDINYIKKSFFDLQDNPIVLQKIGALKEMLCQIGNESAPKCRLTLDMRLYKPFIKGSYEIQELSEREFRAVAYYLKIIFDNSDFVYMYYMHGWLRFIFRNNIDEEHVYEIEQAFRDIISYLFPPLKTYIHFGAICYEEDDNDVFETWLSSKSNLVKESMRSYDSKVRAYIAKESYTQVSNITLNKNVEEFKCFGQVVLKNRFPTINLKAHKSFFEEFDEDTWAASLMHSKINYNYLCLLSLFSSEWK